MARRGTADTTTRHGKAARKPGGRGGAAGSRAAGSKAAGSGPAGATPVAGGTASGKTADGRRAGSRRAATAPAERGGEPCTCFALRRAARVVTQLYDRALAPAGLSIGQFSLLSVLGRADAPMPLTQLARRTDMERSTLTRSLAPLQRDGLVRVAAARAGRGSEATLTAAGRTRLAAALAPWRDAQRAVRDAVGAAELGETLTALDRLRDAVRMG